MYCIISIALIFVGIWLNDIRMLIFSAVFALIDTIGDFRKHEIAHRYIFQLTDQNPKINTKNCSEPNKTEI